MEKKIKNCKILKEGNRGNIKVVMMIDIQAMGRKESQKHFELIKSTENEQIFSVLTEDAEKELRHDFYGIFYNMELHKASVFIY
jgi:hypothetical protein